MTKAKCQNCGYEWETDSQMIKVSCPSCGANIFETSLVTYKKLPAIQSPTGKAQLMGVPIIACLGCQDLF